MSKPGSFRFCASCGSRNKVQSAACAGCGDTFQGRGRAPAPVARISHFGASGRPGPRPVALRWIALAVVALAVSVGLLVRGLFAPAEIAAAGRPVDDGVSAVARVEPAAPPLPPATVWTAAAVRAATLPAPAPMEPPVAVTAPPAGLGAAIEVLPPPPPALGEAAGDTGMTSFTPRPAPRRPRTGQAFTNDDLGARGPNGPQAP